MCRNVYNKENGCNEMKFFNGALFTVKNNIQETNNGSDLNQHLPPTEKMC